MPLLSTLSRSVLCARALLLYRKRTANPSPLLSPSPCVSLRAHSISLCRAHHFFPRHPPSSLRRSFPSALPFWPPVLTITHPRRPSPRCAPRFPYLRSMSPPGISECFGSLVRAFLLGLSYTQGRPLYFFPCFTFELASASLYLPLLRSFISPHCCTHFSRLCADRCLFSSLERRSTSCFPRFAHASNFFTTCSPSLPFSLACLLLSLFPHFGRERKRSSLAR